MEPPARLLDIVNRSLTGPILEEAAFDQEHVTEGIARVVKEYDIRADRETLVNQDDELADRVWVAALDFLTTCGMYCQSTKRVIQFSREEIETYLKQAPDRVEYGAGDGQRLEVARKVEDPRVPMLMGSPIGSPIPENLFVPVMRSYIQEPLVDLACPASIETVYGQEVRTGSPLEILACWREIDLMNEALEKVGRPGMAWTGVIMSMSDVGQLSSVNPAGLRQTGLFTFGLIWELKTNFAILNKVARAVRLGYTIDPYANPIYGGLGGGVDGQAVLITAAMVALSVFFMAVMVGSSPTHPFHFNNTGKELLIAQSLTFQALARRDPQVYSRGWELALAECADRTKHRIIIGDGAVSQLWADEIGADGIAPDAASGSNSARQLSAERASMSGAISERRKPSIKEGHLSRLAHHLGHPKEGRDE